MRRPPISPKGAVRHKRESFASQIAVRPADPADRAGFQIGCRILTRPFFFDQPDWLPVPDSWARNIVSSKTYNTGDADGLALGEAVNDRLQRPAFAGMGEARPASENPTWFGRDWDKVVSASWSPTPTTGAAL